MSTAESQNLGDESLSNSEGGYAFQPLLNTPDIDKVTKKLKTKSTVPLVSVVAAHPIRMTESIWEQALKMLDKRNTVSQKIETKLKLNTKTDDWNSYVPSSLCEKIQSKCQAISKAMKMWKR